MDFSKIILLQLRAIIGVLLSISVTLAAVDNRGNNPKWVSHSQTTMSDSQPSLQLTAIPDQSSDADNVQDVALDRGPQPYMPSPVTLFPKTSPLHQEAFDQVARQAMPMTPDEITKFKDMLAVTKRAASAPPGVPPKPLLSVQPVSLSPGSVPPVIRLQEGFVSSVLFTDSTGSAWPIEAYDMGNSSAFNVQWQPGSNMMMIQAMSMYTYGNLAVRLRGLGTPVMITLVPGQQVVDYRIDLQVDRPQPQQQLASKFFYEKRKLSSPLNTTLLTILNGITPQGAQVLTSSDSDCQAWVLGNKMYLLTHLTLLSPNWLAIMRNSDGTKAYELPKTSAIIVSKYGEPITINFKGLM